MNGIRTNACGQAPRRKTVAEARWVNRRWEQERGYETTDYNNCLALVRASVEEVALALKRRTAHWERDVLGAEITLEPNSLLLFRLRGHVWTEAFSPSRAHDFR
jgi:hypothetical protein